MSKLYNEEYVYGGSRIDIFSVGDLVHWSIWGQVDGKVFSKKKMGVLLEIIVENNAGRDVAYARILPIEKNEGPEVKKLLTTVYLVSKGEEKGNA
tara:strand:+ start:1004 stop:1288 length:285 start_codon:yes stop_codon:yes gene_type:complete